jgi:hypothetical protein
MIGRHKTSLRRVSNANKSRKPHKAQSVGASGAIPMRAAREGSGRRLRINRVAPERSTSWRFGGTSLHLSAGQKLPSQLCSFWSPLHAAFARCRIFTLFLMGQFGGAAPFMQCVTAVPPARPRAGDANQPPSGVLFVCAWARITDGAPPFQVWCRLPPCVYSRGSHGIAGWDTHDLALSRRGSQRGLEPSAVVDSLEPEMSG